MCFNKFIVVVCKFKVVRGLFIFFILLNQAQVHKDGKEILVTGQHHVPILSLAPSTVLAKTPSSEVSNKPVFCIKSQTKRIEDFGHLRMFIFIILYSCLFIFKVLEDIPLTPPDETEQNLESNVPSELSATAMVKCSLSHPFHVQHNFSIKGFVCPLVLVKITGKKIHTLSCNQHVTKELYSTAFIVCPIFFFC